MSIFMNKKGDGHYQAKLRMNCEHLQKLVPIKNNLVPTPGQTVGMIFNDDTFALLFPGFAQQPWPRSGPQIGHF